MKRAFLAALLALPVPGVAPAQTAVFASAATEECLAAGGWTECIGASANACMTARLDGYSPEGTLACLGAEVDYWQREHDTALRQHRERAFAADRIAGKGAGAVNTAALDRMATAWIQWRDAACDYESLGLGGEGDAARARASCLLWLTGSEALRLRSDLAAG